MENIRSFATEIRPQAQSQELVQVVVQAAHRNELLAALAQAREVRGAARIELSDPQLAEAGPGEVGDYLRLHLGAGDLAMVDIENDRFPRNTAVVVAMLERLLDHLRRRPVVVTSDARSAYIAPH